MWLLIPLAGVAGAVLLHGVAMRLPLRVNAVLRFLLVGFPIGVAILVWAVMSGLTAQALAAVALYAFLCEFYMFSFTMVIGSISVSTLVALRDGSEDETVFLARADTSAMVQRRLATLIKNGFAVRANGRYALTPKGRRLHRVFAALRRFFRHDPA